MRRVSFHQQAFKDFAEWGQTDRKVQAKTAMLILDLLRDPFSGLGKPEPLKHNLRGCWSRRINAEHRLVYQVTDDAVVILSCKFHY
jgi:toxin YoeB